MDVVRQLVLAGLPLVGVVLGSWLTSSYDRRKWRRDWLAETVKQRREFHTSAILSLEDQYVVLRQFVGAATTRNPQTAPSDERVKASTEEWRRVLARRYVEAMEPLQNALVTFDQARAALTESLNIRDGLRTSDALTRLESARADVLNAVNLESYAINLELAPFLKPRISFRRSPTWASLANRVPRIPTSTAPDLPHVEEDGH